MGIGYSWTREPSVRDPQREFCHPSDNRSRKMMVESRVIMYRLHFIQLHSASKDLRMEEGQAVLWVNERVL